MKRNPRSLICLCVNYKRLGKYLLDEWSRFILNTHCKNHICKNAQKFNQNCLNPFRTTNNLKSKSVRRQQKPQSFDFTLAISNDSICLPSQISLNAIIGSEASDLQSQAGFRGRWQAWYLGTKFSGRHSCGIQYLHNNLNWSKWLCQQCSNQLGRSSRTLSWGTATRTSSREDWQFSTDVTW